MEYVSIIIPIYNLGNKIANCLESVCNQTYTKLEIILLDDGSEDQSLKICQDYANKDKRIKLFTHENRGVSYTRNRGIQIATGDYLMFADGDDYMSPVWIENYVGAAKKCSTDIVIGGLTVVLENGVLQEKMPSFIGSINKDIWNHICADNTGIFGYAPNKLYRADLIKKNRVYFAEDMHAQEDLDFAISAFAVADSYCVIAEAGYYYCYVAKKREHPLVQYMKNQLKLWMTAKEQIFVDVKSEQMVITRTLSILYTYVYHLPIDGEFTKKCNYLKNIEGLKECIKSYSYKDEKSMVCTLILKERYEMLKLYFSARHFLRRMKRKFLK